MRREKRKQPSVPLYSYCFDMLFRADFMTNGSISCQIKKDMEDFLKGTSSWNCRQDPLNPLEG